MLLNYERTCLQCQADYWLGPKSPEPKIAAKNLPITSDHSIAPMLPHALPPLRLPPQAARRADSCSAAGGSGWRHPGPIPSTDADPSQLSGRSRHPWFRYHHPGKKILTKLLSLHKYTTPYEVHPDNLYPEIIAIEERAASDRIVTPDHLPPTLQQLGLPEPGLERIAGSKWNVLLPKKYWV